MIQDNTITREDFEKSARLNDLEVFTEQEVKAWFGDNKKLIEKSEVDELDEIEKGELNDFMIDSKSLNKVTVIENDLTKSVMYFRPSQVKWDKDEEGNLMKARSGVYKDTPQNRKKGVVGMKYGVGKGKPEVGEKKKKLGLTEGDSTEAYINKQVESSPDYLKSDVKEILNTISESRSVNDRVKKLEEKGYFSSEKPMGSGGVGQIKEMSDHYRLQIGYGHGKHNYALAVILPKKGDE